MSSDLSIKLSQTRTNQLKELESLTGSKFKNLSLLHLAFVHRSYANEEQNRKKIDNERLEFLGDSILGLVAAEYLYQSMPMGSEGKLAKHKSKLVSAPAIAAIARKFKFQEYLLLGRGEKEKGEKNTNIQADCFEAFLGALYLDQGLSACRKFLSPHLESLVVRMDDMEETKDFKTILQEHCQKKWKKIPEYQVLSEDGPDHDKNFLVLVFCENHFQNKGQGKNKRRAEQMAAKSALTSLKLL
ncbi:ribonuclease III [Leptospira sp. 96542]|nr:ribonuclease III [Leptospira sp. 96542]